MRIVVYRVMPSGMRTPTREWHETAKLHLERRCAERHLRTRSTLARQTFDSDDAYDCRFCNFCGGSLAEDPRYSLLSVSTEVREAYLRERVPRWKKAFTHDFVKMGEGALIGVQ